MQLHVIGRGFALVIAIILVSSAAWSQTNPYRQTMEQQRREKDKSFRKGKESPIPQSEKRHFKGLNYFEVDSAFRVQATLTRDTTQSAFQMKTSTSRLPMYRKYGTLYFSLKGQACSLTVYQSLDLLRNPKYRDYLFLPFTDATTDETTYGAGRYIDLRIPVSQTLTIDFNQAYNPYCAYSDEYSCPITPAENRLPIAVQAGEKIYKAH